MNQYVFNALPGSGLTGGRRGPGALSVLAGWRAVVDSLSTESFIRAMRGAATGVNVVTTDGKAGRYGLTVSAFSSVSANPPSVLVCVNRSSPARAAILENDCFCVNVLSSGQRRLAETFSGMSANGMPYDFLQAQWRSSGTGSPVLEGATASFDCTVGTSLDVGTHTIFVGLVCEVVQGEADPLLYINRSYRRVGVDA